MPEINDLTDPRQILALAIACNQVWFMWLAGRQLTITWYFAILGNIGWMIFTVVFQAWGIAPMVLFLTVVYTTNLITWTKRDGGIRYAITKPKPKPKCATCANCTTCNPELKTAA